MLLASRDPLIAKVADFGLSHQMRAESGGASASPTTIRPVAWRAPEALRALSDSRQVVSTVTDVYMAGCVMYELSTCGGTPWDWTGSGQGILMTRAQDLSKTPAQALREHLGGAAMWHVNAPPTAMADAVAVIESCWAETPEDHSSAAELRRRVVMMQRDEGYAYDILAADSN